MTLDSSNFHTPLRDKYKSDAAAVHKPNNSFEKLFTIPSPPPKLPTIKKEKGSGRVPTSVEALKILEEKYIVKAAAEKKKLERQKELLEKSSMLTLDTGIVVNVVEPVLAISCV